MDAFLRGRRLPGVPTAWRAPVSGQIFFLTGFFATAFAVQVW
jgi:hypothetical protein